SGQYSIKLYNTSALGGIPVVGTLCNGQYHPLIQTELAYSFTNPDDPKWHTPFAARPDSIAFWMKYFPVGNDTLQFQALLHVDDCTLPPNSQNEGNQVGYTRCDLPGTYENWTRIALAFEYFDDRTPEYLLMILTSGNGTNSIEGSVAYYDDLEIIIGEQAIYENPLDRINIYRSEGSLIIENMPEDLMKYSKLEIADLSGKIIWQSDIHSTTISLSSVDKLDGLYIVRIITAKYVVNRKIYF
ncbi:MAG: T9SS type A sorting domain-containing protein, partial [Bacteroidales bacterium]